tara:strand:+ start:94 stop:429 length:336 start_codon:yes stop_codon:yes gene_type:complete
MAITHTHNVSDLVVVNDGTGVVSEVQVTSVSVDDSNPSVLTTRSDQRFLVDTSGGASASGFVAYSSLNEATVLGWVNAKIAASNVEVNATASINSVKSPPSGANVSKSLPF